MDEDRNDDDAHRSKVKRALPTPQQQLNNEDHSDTSPPEESDSDLPENENIVKIHEMFVPILCW